MAPGERGKFGGPSSKLRYFGSNCIVLKKVLVTMLGLFGAPAVIRHSHNDLAPGELCPPGYAPAWSDKVFHEIEKLKNKNPLISGSK